MRLILVPTIVLLLAAPALANAETFELLASAGPTLSDPGYTLSAGAGFSPSAHVTVTVTAERTHLASRLRGDALGEAAFRGGTITMAAADLHAALFDRDRVGPYAIAGVAAGVSRPTVNDVFPHAVTNGVRAVFFGGGIQIPLERRFTVFADLRMMIGSEAGELLALAPVRAGIAWRF